VWPQVLTFDCYGTLVQWPETLRRFFVGLLPPEIDVAAFHADFNRFHMASKAGRYRPYSVVLTDALADTMNAWRLGGIIEAQDALLVEIRGIQPYPEVVSVLCSLATRFKLAIISNTEDALVADTLKRLEAPCQLITAQQAGAYKPDPYLFRFALRRLDLTPDDVLHIGAGFYTDMAPAFELGITRIWINRRGEAGDPLRPPTAVLPDMRDLEATIDNLIASRLA